MTQQGWQIRLLTVIFILASFHATTQISLTGVVLDSITGKPLQHAVISNTNGPGNDISDSGGRFSISVDTLPVKIIIRLFGYTQLERLVYSSDPLHILLNPETFLLGEIEVTAPAPERIAGNERRSIWDYAWMDSNLLLCEYGLSLSQSKMLLMSVDGDTLSTANSPGKPVNMFNDCNAKTYLMSRDSLWEFYYANNVLGHYEAESALLVDRVLRYCVGQNVQSIYFAVPSGQEWRIGEDPYAFKYKSNNHVMKYYLFDRNSEKMSLMNVIEDKDVLALKNDEVSYGKGPQPVRQTESAFSKAASQYFFWTILCKEIDAPMYYVRDSLYILDHTSGEIKVMDKEGLLERHLAIKYHTDRDYQRASLVNQEADKLYAVFEHQGSVSIAEINLGTGELMEKIRIPHIFPEHITISGNAIYYLTRDEKVREARVLNRLKF